LLIRHSIYSAILSKITLIQTAFFGDFAHWEWKPNYLKPPVAYLVALLARHFASY